jgi:hypothetical protein
VAIRTTPAAVKAILRDGTANSDYDGVTDLSPFIESFSSIVDEAVTMAVKNGEAINNAEILERWGAAWAYCMADQQFQSRNTMSAGGSFRGQTGMGLDANMYGQTMKTFDRTKWVTAIAEGKVADGQWLGKTAAESVKFLDRIGEDTY